MHSIESHYSLRGTGLMCVMCVCVFFTLRGWTWFCKVSPWGC